MSADRGRCKKSEILVSVFLLIVSNFEKVEGDIWALMGENLSLGDLRTTKAQASPFVISLYINLLLVKFQFLASLCS